MARCRRCGTIYTDGMRHCPKCGEPATDIGGIFAAPRPAAPKEEQTTESVPQQKRAQSSIAIPLPFAVIVIGLLLNPAAHGWLSRICMIYQPPVHIFYALQFGLNCIGLVAVVAILDASRRAHSGGRLLKCVAFILILLTIFGMADSFLAVEKSISRIAGL